MNVKGERFLSRFLVLILAAGVLLRVGSSVALGDKIEILPGIYDQVSYHTLANRLLNGYGFTFNQEWWPLTQAGEPTAHWSYLYTLFLSGIYFVFGEHPLIARILQSIISGALMPLLTFRITRRIFNPRVANQTSSAEAEAISLLAAAWTAVYPYFLYYASALMTESLHIVGILWTIDCGQRIIQEKPVKTSLSTLLIYVELGTAIGVTILLRQVFLLWVPFLVVWLFWSARQDSEWGIVLRRIALRGLISGAMVILLVAPFTLLNYANFGRFVLLNTNAGYAFFWSNHPIHADHFIPLLTADMPSYQELIPPDLRPLDEAALDQALLKRGLAFVTDDPARYLRLSLSRIPVLFNFWPANSSSLPSNLTRVFSLGLAFPFMIAGIIIWIIRGARHEIELSPGLLAISFVVVYTGVHILSWAAVRYRLPIDAVLLILAAQALFLFLKKIGVAAKFMTLLNSDPT